MRKTAYKVWLLIVVLSVPAIIAAALITKDNRTFRFPENEQAFTSSWCLMTDDNKEAITFPYYANKDGIIKITAKLPSVNADTILQVKCKFETMTASVNGEIIYFAQPAALGNIETVMGNHKALIPLTSKHSNQEIVLEIEPRSSLYSVSVQNITLTTMAGHMISVLKSNILNFIIGIILLVLGLASFCVWCGFKLTKKLSDNPVINNFLSISLLAFALGIWLITYMHIYGIITGKMAVSGILNYVAFMFVPFAIADLLKNFYRERKPYFNILYIAAGTVFVCQIALFLWGIFDLSDSLVASHIMCGIIIVATVFALADDGRSGKLKPKTSVVSSIILISMLSIVAIVMYIMDKPWMIYVCFAICILIGTLFTDSIILLYQLMRENVKVEEFRYHAFTDALTGLANRYSYENRIEKAKISDLPNNFTVIVMDVNSLKHTNDVLGHAAGDEMIKGAADCIRLSFENIGTCYRTGGDEFNIFLEADCNTLHESLTQFEQHVKEWKGTLIDSFSISYGWASASEYKGCTIDELITIADKEMYKNKRNFYDTV